MEKTPENTGSTPGTEVNGRYVDYEKFKNLVEELRRLLKSAEGDYRLAYAHIRIETPGLEMPEVSRLRLLNSGVFKVVPIEIYQGAENALKRVYKKTGRPIPQQKEEQKKTTPCKREKSQRTLRNEAKLAETIEREYRQVLTVETKSKPKLPDGYVPQFAFYGLAQRLMQESPYKTIKAIDEVMAERGYTQPGEAKKAYRHDKDCPEGTYTGIVKLVMELDNQDPEEAPKPEMVKYDPSRNYTTGQLIIFGKEIGVVVSKPEKGMIRAFMNKKRKNRLRIFVENTQSVGYENRNGTGISEDFDRH